MYTSCSIFLEALNNAEQITGWPRLFDLLNDLWTPDVKATQLMEVISGVSPIRSVVNVGSGIADLVLLPIAQYKKDGRIVRGVQKGTTAFIKSTAVEAIKLGARLATGTQVILEQAEGVLGDQFQHPITTEALQVPHRGEFIQSEEDEETRELISRYARQPVDLTEGVQTAYHSLQRNFSSAAQTILAVPMEVYERSGSEVRFGILKRELLSNKNAGPRSIRYSRCSHSRIETNDRRQ
jgi:autophagy-related protein 2